MTLRKRACLPRATGTTRSVRAAARAVFFGLCLIWTAAFPAEAPPLEYRVKAAFLFYFANFVQWPAAAFPSADAPLALCVLGDDPFGEVLDEAVAGKRVQRRALVVRRVQQLEALSACHLLFISRSEEGRLRRILQGLQTQSALTISESSDMLRFGGAVAFVLEDRKVRFDINLAAARAASLVLSSKMLAVAREVMQ